MWAIGSITIVLPHLVTDSELTEIRLNENLPDLEYYLLLLLLLLPKDGSGLLTFIGCLFLNVNPQQQNITTGH